MNTDDINSLDSSLHIGGTEIQYYILCPRKLWWFAHQIEQEHSSDLVAMGRHLHEESYPRRKKDILIDGEIRLDFTDAGEVHEVKKSRAGKRAQVWQLKYYLYCMKRKGLEMKGVLDYPKERRREIVTLTTEDEAEIERMLEEIEAVRARETPPEAEIMPLCAKCAYQELCWG